VFVAAPTTQGVATFDPTTRTVTFDLGDLPAGVPLLAQVIARPSGSATTTIDVQVRGNENLHRVGPGDNDVASKVVEVVPAADLGITITQAPDAAVTGGTVTYTIVVGRNEGPSD